QDADATRITGNVVATVLGERVAEDLVRMLRGLPRDSYPTTGDDLKRLGDLIVRLNAAFARQSWLTAEDRRAVARDAGIKIWLLGALAVKRSPAVAASLAAAAFGVSPRSLAGFVLKAARRVTRR